jgi:hypothetical protein
MALRRFYRATGNSLVRSLAFCVYCTVWTKTLGRRGRRESFSVTVCEESNDGGESCRCPLETNMDVLRESELRFEMRCRMERNFRRCYNREQGTLKKCQMKGRKRAHRALEEHSEPLSLCRSCLLLQGPACFALLQCRGASVRRAAPLFLLIET